MSFDPDGSFEAQHAHVAAEEDEGQFMNPQSFTEYDEGEGAEDSDDAVWCICRKSAGGFMIECEACNEWYHGKCIGIDAELGARIDHFTCHRCNNGTFAKISLSVFCAFHLLPPLYFISLLTLSLFLHLCVTSKCLQRPI